MTTSYNPDYDTPHEDESNHSTETSHVEVSGSDRKMESYTMEYVNDAQSVSASPNPNPTSISSSSVMKQDASAMALSAMASPVRSSLQHGVNLKRKYTMSSVEEIVRLTPTCYLKAKCFFVAWNSVITLVFTGWPEPIDTMKKEMESNCTLCKEMFGSKFPKITLACVKDGIEMTPKLLAKVRRLCAQHTVPKDWNVCLDSLSVVLWENRCQESIIYERIIPLKKNHKFRGSPRLLLLNVEPEDDGPYLRSANRTSHYRSLKIGASIVHRLIHVPKFISEFLSKLPSDTFDIFNKESMHVTIRALC